MQERDSHLLSQRRQRQTWIISATVVLLLGLGSYLAFLFLARGYDFDVAPADAVPVQYRVTSGTGLFIGDKFYTFSAVTTVAVSAPKYIPQEISLGASSDSLVSVLLQPKPAQLAMSTVPSVDNAVWRIDGETVHVGASLELELQQGNYGIEVSSQMHEPASLNLSVEKAQQVQRSIELEDISGTLVLASEPAGATVLVNGEQVGITPVRLDREAGLYVVEVQKPGFELLRDEITLNQTHRNPSRQYLLQPEQATLVINAMPEGGALLLDNTPKTSPISIEAMRPQQLVYSKAGYLPYSTSVNLRPGQHQELDVTLAKAVGKVRLTSNERAQISIDGELLGSTPVTLERQALNQSVTFSKPGYRSVTKSFLPIHGKTINVDTVLLTEFAARRAEGKPTVAQSMGINMVEVQPTTFTMGSAANVPRRNRNEHQVQVGFSRSYYLSSTEITEAQFAAFSGTGARTSLPVSNVTWQHAAEFCNWLSLQEGLPPFYNLDTGSYNPDATGYRLPTEAEWEFAAARYRQPGSSKYVWGSVDRLPNKQGNFADKSLRGQQSFVFDNYEDGFTGKAPVGQFKSRNDFFDMAGNVAEWVNDQYDVVAPALNQVHIDYMGSTTGRGHIVKGGSFKTGQLHLLRNALRRQGSAAADDIGFRIARYAGE